MVSTELLQRYPFFGQLDARQLQSLAKIAKEVHLKDGEVIFQEGAPAKALYFLLEGCIDLRYTIMEAYAAIDRKDVLVCQINRGEPFGISALIEPHVLTATASSCEDSRVIRVDAQALEELFASDRELEAVLLRRVARAAIERLHATRVLLATAWA